MKAYFKDSRLHYMIPRRPRPTLFV